MGRIGEYFGTPSVLNNKRAEYIRTLKFEPTYCPTTHARPPLTLLQMTEVGDSIRKK